ncbi:MAG: DUF805 domain-containing protein [Pseudomonadota bacterium]
MRWIIMPWRRCFDFSGRSCRKEFWLFMLLQLLAYLWILLWIYSVFVRAGVAAEAGHPVLIDTMADDLGTPIGLVGVVLLTTLVPTIALEVRRFHDQDRPGALVLLNLIPTIGNVVVLVLMCLPGTKGGNRYGPDPLARGG